MGNPRRHLTVIAFMLVAAAVVAGVALSPLALAAAGNTLALNWQDMGNIGQAYGAASAVFSALAFAAVAMSIAYQARTVNQQRFQVVRELQRELLSMVADDPETYAPALDGHLALLPPTQLRRRLFTVRVLHYLSFGYATGLHSERRLRAEALPGMFASAHSRQFWETGRIHWLSSGNSRPARFARIVDDEYRKAVAAGPPIAPIVEDDQRSPSGPVPAMVPPTPPLVVATALVAAALLAGWAAGRRGR
jgi:hypothetical protein